jgi:hypothetical protein
MAIPTADGLILGAATGIDSAACLSGVAGPSEAAGLGKDVVGCAARRELNQGGNSRKKKSVDQAPAQVAKRTII